MTIIEITAPSHWASHLISGDASSLDPADRAACDAWIAAERVGRPVTGEDAGFCWHHGASRFALASDCQTYAFLTGGTAIKHLAPGEVP